MRVAVFGGSFNPPHVGHALVASWALWSDLVDAVWLLPVYRHAFEGRQDKVLAPFELRVSWCKVLASEVSASVHVSEQERHLPTPSYTIDTLRHLAAAHPEHQFRLLVGADILPQVEDWKDWAGIQRSFTPIVVGRQGYAGPADSVSFPEVSSSLIRQRLVADEPVGHLVTKGVREQLSTSRARALWGTG